MLWSEIFVPQNSYVKTLTPKVLGSGALGEDYEGYEGFAFIDGISNLIKEAPESSVTSSTMQGHSKKSSVCNWNENL